MIPAISAILSVLYVVLVARETRRPCRREGEWRIVEYPLSTQVPALLACALVLWLGVRQGALFLAFLPPLLLWAFYLVRSRIRFSDSQIEVQSWLRSTRAIPVSAIESVQPAIAGWRVSTTAQGSFGFNHMQRGWTELRRMLGNP